MKKRSCRWTVDASTAPSQLVTSLRCTQYPQYPSISSTTEGGLFFPTSSSYFGFIFGI